MPDPNFRGPRCSISYYRFRLMSKTQKVETGSRNSASFMALSLLSLAIEEPDKKFLCKSGVFDRD